MTAKQTTTYHWIKIADAHYALVDNVERDKWTPLGWRETAEPAVDEFVYLRHEGIDTPALFAYGAVPVWNELGWVFGPPPAPVDVTKDPAVFAETTETSTPAAGADQKE